MFHCIAVGGLPPAMRLSAAACSACGPTDASSTQVPPCLLYSLANTATARDSPPLVHQCMTSAFCACTGPASSVATNAPATNPVLRVIRSSRYFPLSAFAPAFDGHG